MQEQERAAQVRTASTINGLIGVWLIVAPFILAYSASSAYWNEIVFGVLLLVLAWARTAYTRVTWLSWVNFLIGVWLIIAPFVLNYAQPVAYWNSIIFGVIAAILALWSIGATRTMTSER